MNTIVLDGIIRNIEYSHTINGVEYDKAQILVKGRTGKENLINLKFKKLSNTYRNNDNVKLLGNVRTYTRKVDDRTKVDVYVFTYFDNADNYIETTNQVTLDGKICKSNGLRKTRDGKDVLDFILANNIVTAEGILNCYVPCVAWGRHAKEVAKLPIGSPLNIVGEMQSREYRKYLNDVDFELKIAHEVSITSIINDGE